MPSIIQGYEYDIFISYRQKDNKYDGWVTEFVENLNKELEATFKEDVSVYFDINPHDGLLETHDVDESLKEKLKCLIFIPIISRTYCDPKAFAWEHEFKAFVEQASKDEFGLKMKLPNGNVASRVLPVRIYDIDTNDIALCETVLGGVLRGIDFIYAEPGVNRPLKSDDDDKSNLNKTKYRNQINKVANAIEEIIDAIKPHDQVPEQSPQKVVKPTTENKKANRVKIIAGSLLAIALIVLGILFIPKFIKPQKLEKSIAVLPFRNESTDQENSAFINGLMEKTLNNLQLIKDFRVISRTSVEQYRDQNKSITEIAKELGVNYIVEGSGQKYGDAFSLSVQLIKADKREDHLWGRSFEQEIKEVDDILAIQTEIAEAIAKELEANITAEERRLIDKVPTQNLTALDFYQTGVEEFRKYQTDIYNLAAVDRAESLFKKALEYDPAFAQVYLGLANIYWDKNYVSEYLSENFLDSVLVLANTSLSYDDDLAEAYVLRGDYFREKGYGDQALAEYDKAIDINPSAWQAYFGSAQMYLHTDLLNAIKNMHEGLSINRGRELPYLLLNIGSLYGYAGFPEISKKYSQEKLMLDSDSIFYFQRLANIEYWTGNIDGAIENYKKVYLLDSTNINALYQLGCFYPYVGQYEESLVFMEKWLAQLDQTLVGYQRYNGMHRVGYAFWINNRFDEADYYFDLQMSYSNGQINSSLQLAQLHYSYYDRAGVYAFRGEKEKAYEDLKIFNQRSIEHIWMATLIKVDPLFESIRNEPEFQQIVRDVEAKYEAEHEKVRQWLEENDML